METECDNGTFGQDCLESCGSCFGEKQCHHTNGTCLNGCNAGYQGLNCTEGNFYFNLIMINIFVMVGEFETEMLCYLSTACSAGHYGLNCLNECSKHCLSAGKCDGKTGECHGGCQAGWKKPTCEASKTKKQRLKMNRYLAFS